jgi:hypothetical protein
MQIYDFPTFFASVPNLVLSCGCNNYTGLAVLPRHAGLFLAMILRKLVQKHKLYGKGLWESLRGMKVVAPLFHSFIRDGSMFFALYVNPWKCHYFLPDQSLFCFRACREFPFEAFRLENR